MKADKHSREQARLAALRGYNILDTLPEDEFDEIVRVVSEICGVPVSLVSLIDADRQWFKAKYGTELTQTPIEMSVCAHGILQPDLLEIEDLTKDIRTIDNPIVAGDPNIRFYAGAALTNPDGYPLGMLCVLDFKPRKLTDAQRDLLRVMAKLVMQQIELRRSLKQEQHARSMVEEILEKANALLDRNTVLRQEIDHRVKNSLTQVAAFLRLQERKHQDEPTIVEALAVARNRVVTVANVHDHLHRTAEDDKVSVKQFLDNLAENISQNRPAHVSAITVEADEIKLPSDRVMALGLAVNEIVTNAMKHAFTSGALGTITISFLHKDGRGGLKISDNGGGVPEGFEIAGSKGLGLRLLNSLAQQLGGTLTYDSGPAGTSFRIDFPLAPT